MTIAATKLDGSVEIIKDVKEVEAKVGYTVVRGNSANDIRVLAASLYAKVERA
jgi:hypothetical protein